MELVTTCCKVIYDEFLHNLTHQVWPPAPHVVVIMLNPPPVSTNTTIPKHRLTRMEYNYRATPAKRPKLDSYFFILGLPLIFRSSNFLLNSSSTPKSDSYFSWAHTSVTKSIFAELFLSSSLGRGQEPASTASSPRRRHRARLLLRFTARRQGSRRSSRRRRDLAAHGVATPPGPSRLHLELSSPATGGRPDTVNHGCSGRWAARVWSLGVDPVPMRRRCGGGQRDAGRPGGGCGQVVAGAAGRRLAAPGGQAVGVVEQRPGGSSRRWLGARRSAEAAALRPGGWRRPGRRVGALAWRAAAAHRAGGSW